jgi:hypothetical protein
MNGQLFSSNLAMLNARFRKGKRSMAKSASDSVTLWARATLVRTRRPVGPATACDLAGQAQTSPRSCHGLRHSLIVWLHPE